MTEPSHAVFLSYASQDQGAAHRICEALRAAGIEVWFDQSELRGGDVWDQSIRKQIKTCALFVPIISRNTHARAEGYFRLEWKLAVDRTHLIMANKAFLIPAVIDDTTDDDENVPEKFREVQWTRLPGGVTQPEFVARIKRLLSPEPLDIARLPADAGSASIARTTSRPSPLSRTLPVVIAVLVLASLAYLLINKPWISKPATPPAMSSATLSPGAPPAAFNPPPHSIAVLPFVNMSGDKEQEYFSDGLTEEILNSLARIEDLRVSARTSSFYFKGEHADLSTIAHKLNVASVLEGSVRRSGETIRVTAQLNNAVTGFHLWSETYDRDLKDVLRLQTEIAEAVASALKVTLLGDVTAKIQVGGTRNPAAFDAYLRATKAYIGRHEQKDLNAAITGYTEAIRLDPEYALAYIGRSIASIGARDFEGLSEQLFNQGRADAEKAIALTPELGEAHAALAGVFVNLLDFRRAAEAYERAVTLAPGSAPVLRDYSDFATAMGQFDTGIAAARRAVQLDPLNRDSHAALLGALYTARRYDEAKAALRNVLAVDPEYVDEYSWYALGNLQDSRKWCEKRPAHWGNQVCLAVVYDKLGRHADAETELAKLMASNPRANDWFQYAEIYAQWGRTSEALACLEKTLQSHHVGLEYLKTDPLLDPLRNEPRFQAIERALKFPD